MGRYRNCLSLFRFSILMFLIVQMGSLLSCTPVPPRGYIKSREEIRRLKRIAILPFENISGEQEASRKIGDIFLTEMLRLFSVVEPGEVEKVLIELRIRSTDKLEVEAIRFLGQKLNVDAIVVGSVLEYRLIKIGNHEIPVLGISSRMLDARTGEILWAAYHTRKGNDAEIIFGIGRITSFGQLSKLVIHDMVKSLAKEVL